MSRSPDRCSSLERGSPETKPRSCGNQPAHESLFNRRLRVLSPAVRISDPTSSATAEQIVASEPLKANMRAGCRPYSSFPLKRESRAARSRPSPWARVSRGRRELSTSWTRGENHRYHHGRRRGQLPATRLLVQASLPGARPRPPRKLLRTGRIRLNVKVTRTTGKSTGIQRYC